jgi:RNA-binding protein YlmH
MADEMFEKRMCELARRARYRGEACFTHFLDLNQQQIAMAVAGSEGVSFMTEGGYEDAERRMGAFYDGEAPEAWQWDIQLVELKWREQFGSVQHRDLLGALMALGFERERMGDIVLLQGRAFVFAQEDIAQYIVNTLESAGRVSITARLSDGVPDIPPPQGKTFRDTVASLRLDAVLAAAFSISRSNAAQAIARGLVYINQAQQFKTDAPVEQGDLISFRGEGRARLTSVDGETRKGRIAVRIFRYGG